AKTVPFLGFINNIPSVILGVVTGLLPTLIMAACILLVPIICRQLAKLAGEPTLSAVELKTQSWYFIFQVIQVFLMTTFTSGASAVVSQVIDDPASPGNKVLYLRATGAAEHMHNHAETTLKSGGSYVALNSGSTYTISFRARWLNGSNQLNTRLYFNRGAQTSLLPVPGNNGTPGAPNSQLTTNIGPTFDHLNHSPAVPAAGESATVSVVASDPDEVDALTLFYRVNSGGWLTAEMTEEEGTWSGVIPGQTSGAKVQFYIRATDALGAMATFPAAGADSRAMIPWNDGQAILDNGSSKPNNVRIVLPTEDIDFLHAETNVMSNDRLPCTVIYNEQEVYYNCAVRLKGSQRGRNQTVRVGFNVRFPVDDKFLGSHEY
ncbi:MAG: hypothetical protein EOP84_33195, partial [Verrucomicrobiaceae bacterium]